MQRHERCSIASARCQPRCTRRRVLRSPPFVPGPSSLRCKGESGRPQLHQRRHTWRPARKRRSRGSEPSSFCSQLLLPCFTPILNVLRWPVPKVFQLRRLPTVKSRRNCERSIHSHDAGVEVEFGDTFEAACRTFFDTHPAAFAIVDQDLVEAIRAFGTRDAGLRTNQITIIASVTGAATETAAGF